MGLLFLRAQRIGQSSVEPEIMLGRKLATGDSQVAGDACFGIQHSIMTVERAIIDPVADVELAWVIDGVDRVVRIVEEAGSSWPPTA